MKTILTPVDKLFLWELFCRCPLRTELIEVFARLSATYIFPESHLLHSTANKFDLFSYCCIQYW